VVGPVRGRSLTSAPPGVNPAAAPSAAAVSRREAAVIQPIKKARVAEEIADRIRVLILDGTLPTGQPLPAERQLAARFGVSRGSVRDAFRLLETIGLLETRHGQGTFARELDVDRLVAPLASILTYRRDLSEELLDVRRMFEPDVEQLLAEIAPVGQDRGQRCDQPIDVELAREGALAVPRLEQADGLEQAERVAHQIGRAHV